MRTKESIKLKQVLAFLEKMTPRIVEDLKSVIGGEVGLEDEYELSNVAFFDFEINVDGYSINLYPSDEDFSQLGYRQLLPEYPDGFIRANDLGLNVMHYDFDNQEDLLAMDDYYETLQSKFIAWFSRCWDMAGGLETSHQFRIGVHGSFEFFDLSRKKWLK